MRLPQGARNLGAEAIMMGEMSEFIVIGEVTPRIKANGKPFSLGAVAVKK
jgi:hypothetical protein